MILWLPLAALAAAGIRCLPIAGGPILAGDLARAVPLFAGISPELVLGYAPAPGARRDYDAAELSRLARRYGLAAEPAMEACFLRPMETLTGERVAAALRAALPGARIEVIEFSRQPIPGGDLRFPIAGLQTDSAGGAPLLWRGAICAPGRDDFPVWAKARVQVSGIRITAAEELRTGHAIRREQLREEPYQGQPGLPSLSQVVGRAPRRPIPAGAFIELRWLGPPDEVTRGEPVQIEIRSGGARVILEGLAQSSGRRGETIGVRNPATGKILRVIVTEPGRAELPALVGESGDR